MKARPKRLITQQRTDTVQALEEANVFLTAQELHSVLKSSGSKAGLSTVYRSLEYLVEAGNVDVIRDQDNVARYRMCREIEHHHHLRCRECHRSIELVDPQIEEWAKKMARRHRFTNVAHEVELVGECQDCRSATK
jgi:Fur family ferric uptake transcriptional regulator